MTSSDALVASLAAVRVATSRLADDAVGSLSDGELLTVQRSIAEDMRRLGAFAAAVAGEIGARSDPSLGHDGLAQRSGFRTPAALVQSVTRSSGRDAATLVQVGALARDDGPSWLRGVGVAVGAGSLSVDAARSISSGLGDPSPTVSPTALLAAADQLLSEAATLDADQVLRRARQLRDDMDAEGVGERERAIYEARGVTRRRLGTGVTQYVVTPDLESGALWDAVYDAMTSPRRGGPRFVDPDDAPDTDAHDPRTIEQVAFDGLTSLLRLAAQSQTVEARRIVGARQPAVRVHVASAALEADTGMGHIEGQDVPVSLRTVERIACSEGIVPIRFDSEGAVLDLGRAQRFFSAKQRIALAARDGGCLFPGCDAPPGWTEAHHFVHWKRDHGRTDVRDGVLLCRFHHVEVHTHGWEIERDDRGRLWLVPPASIDPLQRRRAMPSKSAALRDELRAVRA